MATQNQPLSTQGNPRQVVVLYSYQHDLEWTRVIHAGMFQELSLEQLPDGLNCLMYQDEGPCLPGQMSLDKAESLGLRLVSVLADQAGAVIQRKADHPSAFLLILATEEGTTKLSDRQSAGKPGRAATNGGSLIVV